MVGGGIIKDNYEIAKEVLTGAWGNGVTRRERLTLAGYNYDDVQSIVNALVNDPYYRPVENSVEDVENVQTASVNLLDVELDLSIYDGIHIYITGGEERE